MMDTKRFYCELSSFQTFLSLSIKAILEDPQSLQRKSTDFSTLTTTGTIKWCELYKALNVDCSTEDYAYFYKQATNCQCLFDDIEVNFKYLKTWKDFEDKYKTFYQWIPQKKMIRRCWELLNDSDDETSALHSLSILVSLLERALQDVILTECKQCPRILRDVLLVPRLSSMLSPVVVKFLRLLMGPPVSLNLRNIVWHGFLAPSELHRRYAYAILCTMLSIGETLVKKDTNVCSRIHHRSLNSLPDVVFHECHLIEFNEIERNFLAYSKLIPSMEAIWHTSLGLFRLEKYGECLIVLLPLMEHTMRCMYALLNDDLQRVVTAESSVLFTTFDEILGSTLSNGEKNRFPEFLGECIMSMTMDCLVYQNGPRIRDRLSHGEVDLETVNRNAALSVMTTFSMVLERFFASTSTYEVRWQYKSRFHPIAMLSHKIIQLSSKLCDTESRVMINNMMTEDILLETWKEYEEYCHSFETHFGAMSFTISVMDW